MSRTRRWLLLLALLSAGAAAFGPCDPVPLDRATDGGVEDAAGDALPISEDFPPIGFGLD